MVGGSLLVGIEIIVGQEGWHGMIVGHHHHSALARLLSPGPSAISRKSAFSITTLSVDKTKKP